MHLVAVGSALLLVCVFGAVGSAAALPCSVDACCAAVLVVLAAVLAVGVAPSFVSLVIGWLVNPFANIVF